MILSRKSKTKRLVSDLVNKKRRLERGYARDVAKELRLQGALASSSFEKDGEQAAVSRVQVRKQILAGIIERSSLRVAVLFALSLRQLVSSFPSGKQESKAKKPSLSKEARDYIAKHALSRSEDITKNTIKKLRKVIVTGVEKGYAQSTIAKNINAVIDNPARAKAIARTEVHTAAQYAQDKEAEESDVPLMRVWATAEDETVRPTHARAEGQRRAIGKPFRVGGVLLMFPGDPSGPAEEIINCRCVLLYEPKR